MQNKPVKLFALVLTLIVLVSVSFAACARPGVASNTTGGAQQGGNTSPTSTAVATSTPATTNTVVATDTATTPSASSGNTVHMGTSSFVTNTITITKGSSISLVDDTQVPHIIQNGSWSGTTPQPSSEPGAPTVNVMFNGNDTHPVGPFTTAGTFHLYCTIHPGMNLTVIVQESGKSGGTSGNTVHMGTSSFVTDTITITKGSSISLVDDTPVPHIIQNGSWSDGTAQPNSEPRAPTVNVTFKGNDTQSVGPFTTAGTFHLYCSIHPGMNLTVIVK